MEVAIREQVLGKSSEELEREISQFLIDVLALEDVSVEEIDPAGELFGEGLGLDSVDALEIGVALHKRYGVEVDPKDELTREHFASVRNLAGFVSTYAQRDPE